MHIKDKSFTMTRSRPAFLFEANHNLMKIRNMKIIIEHKQEGITIQKNNWIHHQAEFENKKIKYNVAY